MTLLIQDEILNTWYAHFKGIDRYSLEFHSLGARRTPFLTKYLPVGFVPASQAGADHLGRCSLKVHHLRLSSEFCQGDEINDEKE